MDKDYRMSQEQYDKLVKELEYDKNTRSLEVAELIKEARGFGDLSENSEYDEAKNEQGKLYSRMNELQDIINHAIIVNTDNEETGVVGIGSVVVVTDAAKNKTLPAYTIVGSQEADVMNNLISEDSPFGKALMGKKVGDKVNVEAPKGVMHYVIDSIERK